MEDDASQVESMKTPKRSRRLSSKEFDQTSQVKRSTRKTLILQGIEEAENDVPAVVLVTPSRSTKLIDTGTPSRCNVLATALTPRRSVRKSIKPVQEYENIIAQKGLCSKRAINYTLEDREDEAADGKWVPAVIGRVSAKRGKKARRAKKKQLQSQANILEAGNRNQLNGDNDEKKIQQESEIDAEKIIDENHSGEEAVDEIKKSGQVGKDEELNKRPLKEDILCSESEKQSCNNENHYGDVEPFCQSSGSKYESYSNDQESKTDVKAEEKNKILPSELPSSEVHEDEHSVDLLDSSMESGDIEMETMPVTADDCMESIMTPLSSPYKTANAPSTIGLTDKDDDSDCIMISFNDSLKAEQEEAKLQISEVYKELKPVPDGCDSAESNMPTLLVYSDDDKDEEVFVSSNDSEENNTKLVATAEIENDTSLNRTFDAAISPTKNIESIKQETPKQRPSMIRVPTPFKSAKAIIPDITESQEELDEDGTPEILLESRETKLKSSRKRSFSFCVDRPKKCVTFHSPANTTVAIFDGDLMKTVQDDANNVTERRKRSLSVTETEREVVTYFKERKPFGTPSKKSKLPEPSSKSKMPNFAAIHQMQFQRMESIADHVARRAERAKVLSNSITKVKPTIIQKGLSIKNSVLRDGNQNSGQSKAMPKARQRIQLSSIEPKPKAEANSSLYGNLKLRSTSRPDLAELQEFSLKLSSKMNSSCFVFTGNSKHRLPKPRFDATLNNLKADMKVANKSSTNTTAASVSHAILPDTRPRFNTSTAIDRQPSNGRQKLDDRRKRHLDMFKSRNTSRTGDKKDEILRGVRTNRRFELQMMYRNRPN